MQDRSDTMKSVAQSSGSPLQKPESWPPNDCPKLHHTFIDFIWALRQNSNDYDVAKDAFRPFLEGTPHALPHLYYPDLGGQEGEEIIDLWFELLDAGYSEDEAFEMLMDEDGWLVGGGYKLSSHHANVDKSGKHSEYRPASIGQSTAAFKASAPLKVPLPQLLNCHAVV